MTTLLWVVRGVLALIFILALGVGLTVLAFAVTTIRDHRRGLRSSSNAAQPYASNVTKYGACESCHQTRRCQPVPVDGVTFWLCAGCIPAGVI